MDRNLILHLIRNPWMHADQEVREARLGAADLIERQDRELAALRARVAELEADAAGLHKVMELLRNTRLGWG